MALVDEFFCASAAAAAAATATAAAAATAANQSKLEKQTLEAELD